MYKFNLYKSPPEIKVRLEGTSFNGLLRAVDMLAEDPGVTDIEVDCSRLKVFDTGLLSALLSMKRLCALRNGLLTLRRPTPDIHGLIDVSGMSGMFVLRP